MYRGKTGLVYVLSSYIIHKTRPLLLLRGRCYDHQCMLDAGAIYVIVTDTLVIVLLPRPIIDAEEGKDCSNRPFVPNAML